MIWNQDWRFWGSRSAGKWPTLQLMLIETLLCAGHSERDWGSEDRDTILVFKKFTINAEETGEYRVIPI